MIKKHVTELYLLELLDAAKVYCWTCGEETGIGVAHQLDSCPNCGRDWEEEGIQAVLKVAGILHWMNSNKGLGPGATIRFRLVECLSTAALRTTEDETPDGFVLDPWG